MIDSGRTIGVLTALSLIGVLALFLYSGSIAPHYIALDGLDRAPVGDYVRTNGTVCGSRALSGGSLSLDICDPGSGATAGVYVPPDIAADLNLSGIVPGALIEVTGEVDDYQGQREIAISGADGIVLLRGATGTRYDLWTVLNSVELLDGMTISTDGTVRDMTALHSAEGLLGTSFSITARHDNQTYSLECIFFGTDLGAAYSDGDAIEVRGTISYYTNGGCWQMVVEDVWANNENL